MNKPIIRSAKYNFDNRSYLLWIEYPGFQFRKVELNESDTIYIDIGDHICPVCHQTVNKLEHGVCQRCIDPNEAFRIRLACLFRQPDSYLSQHGTCTASDPQYEITKNMNFRNH